MTETICPHCGHKREPNATTEAWVCPACRKKYYEVTDPKKTTRIGSTEHPADSLKSKLKAGAFLLFVLPIMAVTIPMMGTEGSEARRVMAQQKQLEEQARQQQLAILADKATVLKSCMDAVKSGLKAPASAKFELDVYLRDNGTAWATGYVDAQNSFGALLRQRVSCESTKSGNYWSTKAEIG